MICYASISTDVSSVDNHKDDLTEDQRISGKCGHPKIKIGDNNKYKERLYCS